ncbi:MAG: Beta-glucosidase BoGH3B [Candidatus Anoxychlamydiales bacterium]|nr:Beta-glucosidase BoGH3B [Candidatus Anoxychlamydiales bacterium]
MKRIFLFLFTFLITNFCFSSSIFDQYDKEAKTITAKMNLKQKIGQMILPTFDLLTNQKGPDAMTIAKNAWNKEEGKQLGYTLGFDVIEKYFLSAVLQPGGPITYSGENQDLDQWQKLTEIANLFYVDFSNGKTNLLIGNDAIHGNQHIPGEILFPHNIGLGATHNPSLIKQIATDTMLNLLYSGFNWSYMPTVAISYDYRWGRMYESFSSDSNLVKALAKSYISGLQAIVENSITGVLANAKHFIGDGDTKKGMDEGYTYSTSLKKCWERNGAGYEGAILADVGSVMASYNSLNNVPMHFGGDFDILNQFRNVGIEGTDGNNYQLKGFIVSDFVAVSRAAYKYNILNDKKIDYVEAIAMSINSGVDMFMIANGAYINPFDYTSKPPYTMLSAVYYSDIPTVINAISTAISRKLISKARIDDAVTRIIRTKLAMNHTKQGKDPAQNQKMHSLDAAQQSLILLKNKKKILPFSSNKIKNVFLIGNYDDIGSQNGGWTINWQGQKGNKYWAEGSTNKKRSNASSILDGLKIVLDSPNYYKGEDIILKKKFNKINEKNSIAIIAIAEIPYAEYNGDIDNKNPWYLKGALMKENLYISPIQSKFLGIKFTKNQIKAIKRLNKLNVPIVTILFSGRPLVITKGPGAPLKMSDVFIAAFLPGTSGGEAIINAIFGNYKFKSVRTSIDGKQYYSNTLPFAWPASMREVRLQKPTLFPVAYGLSSD